MLRRFQAKRISWLTAAVVGLAALAAPAGAYASGGNFIATGHDMDFHCYYGDSNECGYLKIAVDKIRNGSSLPILALDQGGTPICEFYWWYGEYCYGGAELPGALEDAGFSSSEIVHVDPTSPSFSTMSFVDSSGKPLYSAIITASDSSCGGCDDNTAGEERINDRASDFATYFNAGGGILALSGAGNAGTYYNFVPLHVSGGATYPPYTVTSEGAAIGIDYSMANCCATHNSFSSVPSGMVALETDSSGIAETLAAFNATITLGGSGGGAFKSGTPAEDPKIAAEGSAVSATEGSSFSGAVATFTDPDAKATASEYTATIDWGDGTTSTATISGSTGGPFTASGTHAYADEGSYTIKTTITDTTEASNTATAESTATVADAPLSASGKTIDSMPQFNGTVATFSDANPNGTASDYAATIEWGDGSSSTGTVSANGGAFNVNGSHAYAQTGPYTIKVHIQDVGGAGAEATSQILVYAFASENGGSFVIGDGNAAVGSQVDFWGARWGSENTLSSGSVPASFKGFAATPSSNPPQCGGTFSTAPGNSSIPPATLPAYMGVYVSSSIVKNGSKLTGDIKHIVVVKTNAGYQNDPGHSGAGEVVTVIC